MSSGAEGLLLKSRQHYITVLTVCSRPVLKRRSLFENGIGTLRSGTVFVIVTPLFLCPALSFKRAPPPRRTPQPPRASAALPELRISSRASNKGVLFSLHLSFCFSWVLFFFFFLLLFLPFSLFPHYDPSPINHRTLSETHRAPASLSCAPRLRTQQRYPHSFPSRPQRSIPSHTVPFGGASGYRDIYRERECDSFSFLLWFVCLFACFCLVFSSRLNGLPLLTGPVSAAGGGRAVF